MPKSISPLSGSSDRCSEQRGVLRICRQHVKFGVIVDVEASRAIRQAEVGAARTMITRTEARFGLKPSWLAADTAYGSAPNIHWMVNEKGIAPHVPVIDKSKRDDGTLSREAFVYDKDESTGTSTAPVPPPLN